jgi:hypothetical protein
MANAEVGIANAQMAHLTSSAAQTWDAGGVEPGSDAVEIVHAVACNNFEL